MTYPSWRGLIVVSGSESSSRVQSASLSINIAGVPAALRSVAHAGHSGATDRDCGFHRARRPGWQRVGEPSQRTFHGTQVSAAVFARKVAIGNRS